MKKIIFLSYGIFCYLAFPGTVVYAIGFMGNFVVPKTIDSEPQIPLFLALFINTTLLLLFIWQHRVIASPAFKKRLLRIIPEPLERSTHVLLVCFFAMLIMWQWQPFGTVVWSIEDEAVKAILLAVYFSGWSIVLVSTFLINHFDLFGLRQVWVYFTGKSYTPLAFTLPFFYKLVRHPLYFGFLIAFWSSSVMTISHLLLAILATGYVLKKTCLTKQTLQRFTFLFMFTAKNKQ